MMALGGGTWTVQDKVLPGTYINFASRVQAAAVLSDRGIAAAPFVLSWGPEKTVFEVTAQKLAKDCKKIFGYSYDAPELIALREIFANAVKVYCYRLGEGTKAANTYATAKYAGARGNALKIKITADADNTGYFVVATLLDGEVVDEQTVNSVTALKANDFVDWKSDFSLAAAAGTALTGGADCASITGTHYQACLDAFESYSFNALCCPATDAVTVGLFVNYAKRMRDTLGKKFQLCAIKPTADYEGVIGVWNTAELNGTVSDALVYWVTGAESNAAVNRSLTNTLYNGELTVDTAYTQSALESAVKAGKFMLHAVGDKVRVLCDINTLTTYTDEKSADFANNQTVRICDQIANDSAVLFNTRYVGAVPNDASGRAALWNDLVKIIKRLEQLRAIENFDENSVTVEQGDTKGSVVFTLNGLGIVNAMQQLYMSVVIQ